MSVLADLPFAMRVAPPVVLGGRRAARLVERNILSYRRMWPAFVTGLFEPVFYLFALGVGLGALVGDVVGPGGRSIAYADFVAPGLLAASAMNGAIIDATFGLFFKLKYAKTYQAVLATPLGVRDIAFGEISWALLRGSVYAAAFIAVMVARGLVSSPWAVLALPACILIAFGFAATAMSLTTYMRGWADFDYIQVVLLPLFLCSATFYPLSTYTPALRIVVQLTPLYHGVELLRGLCVGVVGWGLLAHVAYLAAMAAVGTIAVGRRLERLLLV